MRLQNRLNALEVWREAGRSPAGARNRGGAGKKGDIAIEDHIAGLDGIFIPSLSITIWMSSQTFRFSAGFRRR